MRPTTAITPLLLCALLGGCGSSGATGSTPTPAPLDGAIRYLTDPEFRRAEAAASLVNPANGYSHLRLTHYQASWETLPVWNPGAAPFTLADFGSGDQPVAAATALDVEREPSSWTLDELRALGREAFFRYPAQLLPSASVALASADVAASYGLWIDATRGVGGLVSATMPDGAPRIAMTCSTCHARPSGSSLAIGAPNNALDLGRLALDAQGDDGSSLATNLRAWGPGRLDVSSADGAEIARIPDLRPARYLTHLHQDATVAQRGPTSLAIRIETLVVTSHGQVLRPPRPVAMGLALYLWSLADTLPARAPLDAHEQRGEGLFAQRCEGCHHGEGYTGAPVPLDVVATSPTLGLSPERGTDHYRTPSLRGVGSRGPLLHDASLPTVDALLDPARRSPAYMGARTPGALRGHEYGLDLGVEDLADLAAFVRGL